MWICGKPGALAECCEFRFHKRLWITWLHMWIAAWAPRLSTANPPAWAWLSTAYPQVIHMTCATRKRLAPS